jgi:general secretion pathway protein D
MPNPLRPPAKDTVHATAIPVPTDAHIVPPETTFQSTPSVSNREQTDIGLTAEVIPKFPNPAPVTVNVDGLPLPAFINEVFGNLLGLSFQVDPTLKTQTDLVTLRVSEPQSPEQMYHLAWQVLNSYGVSIVQQNNLLRFVPRATAQTLEPPLLVSGRTLPAVPISHRPIFQFVPLKAVSTTQIVQWLQVAYASPELQVQQDVKTNSVLLKGTPNLVRQALDAIQFLDQPFMRGRQGMRINPAFLKADDLAAQLMSVLETEGYAVGLKGAPATSIIILPIASVNALIIFATDEQVLTHIKQWVATLDSPGRVTEQGKPSLFFYPVQNTGAENLMKVLSPLIDGSVFNSAPTTPATPGAAPVASVSGGNKKLVVDTVRNAILFQGMPEEWARLLPILQEVDQPSKIVMVEVTVAQITLTDTERFGIEWLLNHVGVDGLDGTLKTLGGLSISGSGLNYTLNNGGQTRALLNAFAQNDRITVLSTPRLMVKSGEGASIQVGDEVPIVTSQSSSSGTQVEGNTAILQQIQYRSTGIQLQVKPVVHAGNQIDLEISQSVSSSSGSDNNTPTISNRSIQTKLTLNDGSSVLLGGLISTTIDQQDRGIPLLKDIPVVGSLFKVQGTAQTRNELIIVITPYVVSNDTEAQGITEAFRQQLHFTGQKKEVIVKPAPVDKLPQKPLSPFKPLPKKKKP